MVGSFLALAAWYGICKGGFGTRLAFSKNSLRPWKKSLKACRLSPLESPVYLNIKILFTEVSCSETL